MPASSFRVAFLTCAVYLMSAKSGRGQGRVYTVVQSTLWDLVASSVPWDVQPPAEGKLSAHETLAKTVLLLLLASPGIPMLPQDVMEDARHLSTLKQCLAFRKAYAAQLTPRTFDPERTVQWHGATPGATLPQVVAISTSAVAHFRHPACRSGKVEHRALPACAPENPSPTL